MRYGEGSGDEDCSTPGATEVGPSGRLSSIRLDGETSPPTSPRLHPSLSWLGASSPYIWYYSSCEGHRVETGAVKRPTSLGPVPVPYDPLSDSVVEEEEKGRPSRRADVRLLVVVVPGRHDGETGAARVLVPREEVRARLIPFLSVYRRPED